MVVLVERPRGEAEAVKIKFVATKYMWKMMWYTPSGKLDKEFIFWVNKHLPHFPNIKDAERPKL